MVNAARPKKYFTLEEANAILPLVRSIAADITTLSAELQDRRRRLAQLRSRQRPDRRDVYSEELEQADQALTEEERQVEEYARELAGLGVETEAAAEGLFAFPSLQNGREIQLCWKFGEPRVAHWHESGADRRQRRPLDTLDADFSAGLNPSP